MGMIPKGVKVTIHATNDTKFFERADFILPNVSSYEKSGSAINALGRLQKIQGPLPAQHMARDMHSVAFGLSIGNDRETPSARRWEQLFEKVISQKILKQALSWKAIDPLGLPLSDQIEKEGSASA